MLLDVGITATCTRVPAQLCFQNLSALSTDLHTGGDGRVGDGDGWRAALGCVGGREGSGMCVRWQGGS